MYRDPQHHVQRPPSVFAYVFILIRANRKPATSFYDPRLAQEQSGDLFTDPESLHLYPRSPAPHQRKPARPLRLPRSISFTKKKRQVSADTADPERWLE